MSTPLVENPCRPSGRGRSIRQMVGADMGIDRIGIAATDDGGLGFSFPVVVVSGVK
ncbi:MAG TPA: hypothetical protein VMZ71_13850 [Gemmataceae bacterium]|nr:hypothetical protein [Gemmataceae bacterium]